MAYVDQVLNTNDVTPHLSTMQEYESTQQDGHIDINVGFEDFNINNNDDDHVELLDAHAVLHRAWPSLVTRPGVSTWKVADYKAASSSDDNDEATLQWLDTHQHAINAGIPNVQQSMWPPASSSLIAQELHKCVRLWPHDQDTGGFFVALLRRTIHKKKTK